MSEYLKATWLTSAELRLLLDLLDDHIAEGPLDPGVNLRHTRGELVRAIPRPGLFPTEVRDGA